MGILDELNQGLSDLRQADLPKYDNRVRALEIKLKDLEHQLKPLLAILKK